MRSLFDSDSGECFPMSQDISQVLRWRCFRVFATCLFQVRRLSKSSPRYLTVLACGIAVWLMRTEGQCPRHRVNVMCVDFVSLIFSLHFLVHCPILCRWSWRWAEAVLGSGWVVKMAVSSAKVLRVVEGDWEIWSVNVIPVPKSLERLDLCCMCGF
jgi:hypothetical protein